MAAYISFQPTDFFNPVTYIGDESGQTITTGFQPDFIWIKTRNATYNHQLVDAVRGNTKYLKSNLAEVESTTTDAVTSFVSTGFTLGADTPGWVNQNSKEIVSWNWKAGTTSGITGGTITPSSYSINTTSGFGIYTWAGTGVAGTIAHGLGVTPKMVILKCTTHDNYWMVYHNGVAADAETDYLNLNDATAAVDNATIWNDTAPTSSVFSIGTNTDVNGSGRDYVAYVFADVKGYSSFNSYTGNGNADGSFIYTGFRPSFVMVKASAAATGWYMFDDKRLGYNPKNGSLYANSTAVEISSTLWVDLLSNGFKFRNAEVDINASGVNFVYMAFAKFPLVSSNSKAGTAR